MALVRLRHFLFLKLEGNGRLLVSKAPLMVIETRIAAILQLEDGALQHVGA